MLSPPAIQPGEETAMKGILASVAALGLIATPVMASTTTTKTPAAASTKAAKAAKKADKAAAKAAAKNAPKKGK
jgi:hypothetical protein